MKSSHLGLDRDYRTNYAPPKALVIEAFDLKLKELSNFKNALKSSEWCKAMQEEFEALKSNKTWDLVSYDSI